MKKPNIIALPTSQMQAYCDVLGIPREEQSGTSSMIIALEAADFSVLQKGKTHGFDPDKVDADIVAARKAKLGIT